MKKFADAKLVEFKKTKAKLEGILRNYGICKYQDIDPASGKKMRMLAEVDFLCGSRGLFVI